MVLDTETTGLPEKGPGFGKLYAPWDTMKYKGARLVQLAYSIYTTDGVLVREVNVYIKPSDFAIPADSTRIHGITNEFAKENGKSILMVLRDLEKDILNAYMVIGHNISFDRAILESEAWRNGMNEFAMMMQQIPWACTMRAGIAACGTDKWPRLGELYRVLCGGEFGCKEGAHNAMEDVRATARCWLALRERGLML